MNLYDIDNQIEYAKTKLRDNPSDFKQGYLKALQDMRELIKNEQR
jgi:hypothetical protein